jgi:hypothetical protein
MEVKKLTFKNSSYQPRHLKERIEKSHFFGAHFSCEQDGEPNFKFDIDLQVLFIYRLIPREPDFLERVAIFDTTPIGRFRRASRSVHGRSQRTRACF